MSKTLPERLRDAARKLRTSSMPLSDFIPLLQQAADYIEAQGVPQYDQQALELCEACGWKTLIPDEGCLNCERKPLTDAQQIAEALRKHGLTLIKTANGYDAIKLGECVAHGIKE